MELDAARDALRALQSGQDLARLIQTDVSRLYYLAYRCAAEDKYRTFEIPKRRGGMRTIHAPKGALYELQASIGGILQDAYEAPSPANGFVRERSILRNAVPHVRRRLVLNIDIKNFFPSIHFGRVRGVLRARPYSVHERVATLIAQLCCCNGLLPQGAPSSPVISNMVCVRLDRELRDLARRSRCYYTRYADDITFSTSMAAFPTDICVRQSAGSERSVVVGGELAGIFEKNGFEINGDKTKCMHSSNHQEVTGITVNDKVNVRRRYIREVRGLMDAWGKFPAKDLNERYHFALSRSGRRSWDGYVDVASCLRGKLEFLRSVKGPDDPCYYRYASRLRAVDPDFRPDDTFVIATSGSGQKDVFICHAREDKAIARAIRDGLAPHSISCWIDVAQVKWGENIVDKVNEGLHSAAFALVILSTKFMEKLWPQAELAGALARELESGELRVLPLLVGTEEERKAILRRNTLLSGKMHLVWNGGAAEVVEHLVALDKARKEKALN